MKMLLSLRKRSRAQNPLPRLKTYSSRAAGQKAARMKMVKLVKLFMTGPSRFLPCRLAKDCFILESCSV